MTILTNAFSLQMVAGLDTSAIIIEKVNRSSQRLTYGDVVYVAQFVGGRLPEGATTLPEGVSLQFFRVTIKPVWIPEEQCRTCRDLCGPCSATCEMCGRF